MAKKIITATIIIVALAAAALILLPTPSQSEFDAHAVAYSPASKDVNPEDLDLEYRSLLSGSDLAQYDAVSGIFASGAYSTDEGADEGWSDAIGFTAEDLHDEVRRLVTYDNPLYTAYCTGIKDHNNIVLNVDTGAIAIRSAGAEMGEADARGLYEQADAAARSLASMIEEECDGTSSDFVAKIHEAIACDVEYVEAPTFADPHSNDIYGCLIEGRSACYGMSAAIKYVLDIKGIPSFIAAGHYGEISHAWVMAYFDGKWRMVDATIGNSAYSSPLYPIIGDPNVRAGYYLTFEQVSALTSEQLTMKPISEELLASAEAQTEALSSNRGNR